MKPLPSTRSEIDSSYADFGKGRFDVVSGSKISHIVAHAGQSILDVGCGPGAYMHALGAQGYDVEGVERNSILAAKARAAGFRIFDLDLDIDGLSAIGDKSYDTVICLDVLEHLANPTTVLNDMARIARSNVIVSVPAESPRELVSSGFVYASYVDVTHVRYYTPMYLSKCMESAGLHNIRVHPTFAVQPIHFHLFAQERLWLIKILNRILLRLIVPQSNWSVLMGIGYVSAK